MTQRLFLRSALAAMMMGTLVAQAQPAAEANPVKPAAMQTLEAVEAVLQQNPTQVEARFQKAVLLSELGRDTEALELFRQLSLDLPAAPEPLNNLGVLYAKQGLLEEARNALRQAVEKDARYATAYENLGDVYARLAAGAYEKTLQLEPNTATVSPKLRLVAQIVPPPANAAPTRAPAPGAGGGTTKPRKGTKPIETPPDVALAPAPAAAVSTPVNPANASAQEVPPPPASTGATASAPEVQAVEQVVLAWAQAWSNRDVPAYLAHYTADYAPEGSSRGDWEAQRRERIEGKSNIVVQVEGLAVEVQGQQATARFTQRYAANNHRSKDRKTLSLVRVGEGWKIRQETSR